MRSSEWNPMMGSVPSSKAHTLSLPTMCQHSKEVPIMRGLSPEPKGAGTLISDLQAPTVGEKVA